MTMEYAMLGIGVALGVILGLIGAMLARIQAFAADMQRMANEIHQLAKSHVEMAHALNHISIGISQAHTMLNEHDQMIALMRHEEETDFPVH